MRSKRYTIWLGLALLLLASAVRAECYVDPATGQRFCTNGPAENWVTVAGPVGGVAVGDYGASANVGNVGVVVGGGSPIYRPAPPQPAARPLPARCRIFVGDRTCGSGTLVSDSIVLTCHHLFADSRANIVCQFPDGRRFGGAVIDTDPINDLAAVRIAPAGIAPAAVSPNDPTGMLVAGGFGPDGVFGAVQGSIVGQFMPEGASDPAVCISGASRPGDSGGAVVDQTRAIVGVAWGCKDGYTYLTCGRPLRNFLQRVLGRQQIIVANQPIRELPTIQPVNPPISEPPAAHGPELVPIQPPVANPQPPTVPQPAAPSEANIRTWISDAIGKIERGPKGDKGDQGPQGSPGSSGAPAPPADTSKFATKEDLAAGIASKVARDGSLWLLGSLGLSTGLAGIVAWLVGRGAAREVRRVIERHQPSNTAAAGGPSNTGFRSY